MAARVAIVDPLPMFRHGVAAVLSAAGHTVEMPADVLAWVRRTPDTIVLVTLESEPDWVMLARLCDRQSIGVVIALVTEDSTASGVRAMRAGARSVVGRHVTVDVLRRTVDAVVDGQAVMPASVAAVLATEVLQETAASPDLSPDQLSWLRRLAAGSTVAQLANEVGYSERAMFRLLKSMYQQMGVPNRVQAIVRAQEQGWLRDTGSGPSPVGDVPLRNARDGSGRTAPPR